MTVVRRIRRGAGSMRVHVIAASCVCASLTALASSGLTFQAPDGWKSLPPSSSMRVADFSLPRAAGDAEDAELVVYYFGGEGGGVDANIARWESQMVPPPGKTPVPTRRETRTVNGLKVTLVDVHGTYVAAMMPGASAHNDKPGFRLRAGVVETPKGPYFLKLTGPEKTVAKWDDAFGRFVASLKYQ